MKDVRCFISRTTNPFLNLAIEEWLFRSTPASSHVLLLWRNKPCVVIGRNQNPWSECNVHALDADSVPWLRRKSGGGTVFHDMGNSIYSIIEPRADFHRRKNADLVSRALQNLDIPASVNERHDIVVDAKKVSGSAFKLTNHRAYHHGTMLINADLVSLRKYLKVSKPGMVSKGVPSVPSPVTNLGEYSLTVDHSGFCESVVDQFRRVHDLGYLKAENVDDAILDREPKVREAYAELMSDDWRLGQTPDFKHDFALSADLRSHVQCKDGKFKELEFVPTGNTKHDELYVAGLEDLAQLLTNRWYHPTAVTESWPAFVAMQGGSVTETHPAMAQLRSTLDRFALAL